MPKVAVYLYPGYISLDGVLGFPSTIFRLLGVPMEDLVEVRWDGCIESIPGADAGPVMIRLSSKMSANRNALAELCAERGHLLFYVSGGEHDQALYGADGHRIKDERTVQSVIEEFKRRHSIA